MRPAFTQWLRQTIGFAQQQVQACCLSYGRRDETLFFKWPMVTSQSSSRTCFLGAIRASFRPRSLCRLREGCRGHMLWVGAQKHDVVLLADTAQWAQGWAWPLPVHGTAANFGAGCRSWTSAPLSGNCTNAASHQPLH